MTVRMMTMQSGQSLGKKRCWLLYSLCLALLLSVCVSTQALASPLVDFTDPSGGSIDISTMENCASGSGYTEEQITSQVVFCIRSVIYYSVGIIMYAMATYIYDTIVVAYALAVCFWGIRMMGGEPQVLPRAAGSLLRWSMVYMFFWHLPYIAYYSFAMVDWLISLVTPPGYLPWTQIDGFFQRLFGFTSNTTMTNGVAGIIFAIAISAGSGGSVFGTAAMAVFNLMNFVLETIYAYLTSLLIIGFLMIIAPFIVPLALFNYTERFFKKWLHNVLGAMLVPMMLYGFLAMSLDYFEILITDSLNALSQEITDANGNPAYDQFWRTHQPLYSWIAPGDPNEAEKMRAQINNNLAPGVTRPKIMPPIATEQNPYARVGMDMNQTFNFATTYNPNELREILFSFLALWIYASMLLGLTRKMPAIAQSIAASAQVGIFGVAGSFGQRAAKGMSDAAYGAGFIAGGYLGSGLGKMAGGKQSVSAGAIVGGVFGGRLVSQKADQLGETLKNMVGRRT